MNNIGIYKITSPSNKVYIGQSWNLIQRKKVYSRTACHKQQKLFASINKYGWDAHKFEVVMNVSETIPQLMFDAIEQSYMDYYRRNGVELLNLKEAGSHGKHSKETCEKISLNNKGKRLSPESIEKMRKSLRGKVSWNKGLKGVYKHSEESKKRISDKNKGRPGIKGIPMPDHTREAIRKANLGAKRSPETCEKISKATTGKRGHFKNKGKVRTPENRRKISDSLKARTDNKGESHKMAKLTTTQVLEIREKRGTVSSAKVAKLYNISNTNVKDIWNRKIWRHV